VYLIFCQDIVFSFSVTKNSDVTSTIEKLIVVNNWSIGMGWDARQEKDKLFSTLYTLLSVLRIRK
jgi:hypothetical protein